MSIDAAGLRAALRDSAPVLWNAIGVCSERWLAPAKARLDQRGPAHGYPKTINDPVWGEIEFLPWETVLLDAPLLQRLRGVRQLGMAHLVYPGAGHDRLEHSRGVVEAAERMMRALDRNASHRSMFGRDKDPDVPRVNDEDRFAIRMAALLHDVGHGPFSHATEALIGQRARSEMSAARDKLRDVFEGVTTIAPGELISVFVVMSEAMRAVLTHERFDCPYPERAALAAALAARLIGSRTLLRAGYLSGIVSGPVDADKLDYMARDCHHAGLALGLDFGRLISKLEVVIVTPSNAPTPDLKKRSEAAPGSRIYELGVALSGLGAYEQMIIGRVLLYDRIYYHHKVRSAEAMARRLIVLAEEERGTPYEVASFFADFADDTMVALFGGQLSSESLGSGKEHSRRLAQALLDRDVYYRCYAFASRFIAGYEALRQEQPGIFNDIVQSVWTSILTALRDDTACAGVADTIYSKAVELGQLLPEFQDRMSGFRPEHVLVDLPTNKVVARGGDILTRTDADVLGTPNLFFDPERWSQAYEHQKHCGFVFTPRRYVRLVAVAARIVFFERFGVVMGEMSDRASKTTGELSGAWFQKAAEAGVCTAEAAEQIGAPKIRWLRFSAEEIKLPGEWLSESPGITSAFRDQLNDCLPSGVAPNVKLGILSAVQHLSSFISVSELGGHFVALQSLSEKELQCKVRDHIRARGAEVREAEVVGGGEVDLVLTVGPVLIENKVLNAPTNSPFDELPNATWQARRYAIAICSSVRIVVLAYRPKDETGMILQSARMKVQPRTENEPCELRVVVPWSHSVPSKVRAPQQDLAPDS